MKVLFLIFLTAVIMSPAAAEVIKCRLPSGKTVYQSTPCSSAAISQKIVDIKTPNPDQVEEAQTKLKTWQAQQAAEEAEKIKAAKEQQQELDRQQTIDALNRNAIAQQQQAIAAQRQAEALERRNNGLLYNSPYLYGTPYYRFQPFGYYDGHPGSGFHDHHEMHRNDWPRQKPHDKQAPDDKPNRPQGMRPLTGR